MEKFATGIAAIDEAGEYTRITFCSDQAFGTPAIAERSLVLRLVLTPAARALLLAALSERSARAH